IFEDAVATFCAYRVRHSSRHLTERISHPGNRASVCECRPTDDSQPNPPPWWTSLFRAFLDSIPCGAVVGAQRRHWTPTIGIGLGFGRVFLRNFRNFALPFP